MSLAKTPRFSVEGIREHEESHAPVQRTNVGQVERWVSTIGGSLLIAQGVRSRSLPGAALALLGAGLIYRGVSGHCGAYQALNIDTSDKHRSDADEHVHHGRLIKHSLIVERPAQELYDYWRQVENSPRFMTNIEKVIRTGPKTSHWVSSGPLGQSFEWDSEIINDDPGRLIAWKSLPGSAVPNAGTIHFDSVAGSKATKITLEVNYEPPAGVFGVAVAKLIGQDPDAMTRENLRHFKQLMETGEIPTTTGQTSGRA